MQAMRNYEWATDKVETVTRQHREAQACERRLRQMAAKREKDASGWRRVNCCQLTPEFRAPVLRSPAMNSSAAGAAAEGSNDE